MSVFRNLMMRRHKAQEEYVKLLPKSMQFEDSESTKDLTIESNANWSIGIRYNETL